LPELPPRPGSGATLTLSAAEAEALAAGAAPAAAPAVSQASVYPDGRMRVAIDARKLRDRESGVGSYIVNLVQSLLGQDGAPSILLIRAGKPRPAVVDGVDEVFVRYPAEIALTPGRLAPALRGRRYDLFHSPFDIAPRGLESPVVVTIHDINWIVNPAYNSYNLFMRKAGGFFYKKRLTDAMQTASRIIAISHATRNAIVEYAPWHETKIRVVRNGVDHRRIHPVPAHEAERLVAPILGAEHPFVLTVGQASPYKNHFHAVSAFLRAFADRPQYRMVLVRRPAAGDRQLEKLLATPAARERVRCVVSVRPAVLNALYNRARIVLHPSYYEGFGLPLVEAMAAGTPLVASSVSSMPEIVGPAGVLVSPADVGALADALIALDRDEVLRARLVAAGRERLALFDWDAAARATLEIYGEALRAEAFAASRARAAAAR
jgi:glycosyltransferase involved in cell wall biosynthesis